MQKKVIIGVSLFMLLVIGITYAWFTWNSEENTNVSVTIEGINITYEDGEDITGINLIPVSTKEKGETDGTAIAKEITVSSTMNAYLNLNMNLELLPDGLKDASFKWEFYKEEELKSSGNFADNNQGDNISLLSQELVTSSVSTYKLYIWIDGNMNNPNTMQNQTFKFMLNANASDNVSEPSGPDIEYGIATDTVTKLLDDNPETMNNDDPDGNIRYMGANPNNYVTFNNELWRIIGVFDVKSSEAGQPEKRLKIIRNESLENMEWDINGSNNWATASLNTYLNGEYYNTIDQTSKDLIGETYWNLGGTALYTNPTDGLASHWYNYERGTVVYSNRPTYMIEKIGLMYPSDYGYATSGGATTNKEACLAKELFSWNDSSYSDCKNNDYLYDSSFYQWTLTPYSSNTNIVFLVSDSGGINRYYLVTHSLVARPTIYLNSDVTIAGGDGSSTDPFILR